LKKDFVVDEISNCGKQIDAERGTAFMLIARSLDTGEVEIHYA